MKNFRGSALAAGVGTPESAPHELLGSSLIFICVSNIGTVLKNIPCVSECVTSSITVPQSSRMTHHLSLNDNPVIIYGHLAILHGLPRHPARPTSPSCTTHLAILHGPPRHPARPTSPSCTTHLAILHDPPRHHELVSESVLRKLRFRIESG